MHKWYVQHRELQCTIAFNRFWKKWISLIFSAIRSDEFIFKSLFSNYQGNFLRQQKSTKPQFYLLNDALQREQKRRNEFYTAEALLIADMTKI